LQREVADAPGSGSRSGGTSASPCTGRCLGLANRFLRQNFGYLVWSIGGWESFVGVGVGTELVALAILLAGFRRRGWF
jgi:hypothetical protein